MQISLGAEWRTELVGRIRNGDCGAEEQLYRLLSGGIRVLCLRLGGAEDLEDRIQDTFLQLLRALRRGDLREPERLFGFVRAIVRHRAAAAVQCAVKSPRTESLEGVDPAAAPREAADPEQRLLRKEQEAMMLRVLLGLNAQYREVLVRFYLREEPWEQICRDMSLTYDQFRQLKSRAKARFGAQGKAMMAAA